MLNQKAQMGAAMKAAYTKKTKKEERGVIPAMSAPEEVAAQIATIEKLHDADINTILARYVIDHAESSASIMYISLTTYVFNRVEYLKLIDEAKKIIVEHPSISNEDIMDILEKTYMNTTDRGMEGIYEKSARQAGLKFISYVRVLVHLNAPG